MGWGPAKWFRRASGGMMFIRPRGALSSLPPALLSSQVPSPKLASYHSIFSPSASKETCSQYQGLGETGSISWHQLTTGQCYGGHGEPHVLPPNIGHYFLYPGCNILTKKILSLTLDGERLDELRPQQYPRIRVIKDLKVSRFNFPNF